MAQESVQKPVQKKVRDGRSMRAERNRQLIAETFLDLLEKGEVQPTAQMVSEHSGVSTSTIFRLYEDLEALQYSAFRIQFARVRTMFVEISSDQTLDARINDLVDMRCAFYEKVATIRRFIVSLRPRPKLFDEALGLNEKLFRSQVQALFSPELTDLGCGKEVLDIIDTLTSWEAWDRMRVSQKMSAKRARHTLKTALLRLLSD